MNFREFDCTTQRAHFMMVSISRYVKIVASGWFSQIRSHTVESG